MNVRQSCHVLIKKTTQKDIFFGFCSNFRVLKRYYCQREFDAVHRILVEIGPIFRKFQREFDAVHRIPVERKGLSMGIRCSASNSIPFNGNSMHCIEFQLKDTGLSTGIRCSASNSGVLRWNSMHCIEFPLNCPLFQQRFDALHRIPVETNSLSTRIRCSASNSSVQQKNYIV